MLSIRVSCTTSAIQGATVPQSSYKELGKVFLIYFEEGKVNHA